MNFNKSKESIRQGAEHILNT
ncbi:hypothetical protein ABVF33_00215 [Candidatus Rickettsia barbariae]